MREDVEALVERTLDFSANIVLLVDKYPQRMTGRHIGGQLLRSGTSVGANYEEACAAESRADFIHKLQIVLKELRESRFWLKLTLRTNLLPGDSCSHIAKETDELCRIIAKSILTARGVSTTSRAKRHPTEPSDR